MHNSANQLNNYIIVIVLFLVAINPTFAASTTVTDRETENEDILTIARAVQIALRDHPTIASQKALAAAMQQIPERVASLDDPTISIKFANMPVDDFGLGNDPMTQIQLALSQNLPYPGKLALKKSIATYTADASEIDVRDLQLRIVNQIKSAWWQVFYNKKALETVLYNQTLLRQLIEIAQVKYKVGKGSQQNVLLAQLELSSLLDGEIRIQESYRLSLVRLNSIMNRSTTSPILFPKRVNVDLPKLREQSILIKWSHEEHPKVIAKQKRIESARQNLALARQDRNPDFKLAAIYGQRDKLSDLASIQFAMSLPIFVKHKQEKMVDQRNSELLQMHYSLDDLYRELDADINIAILKYESASKQSVLLNSGIIPQAQQAVQSMRASYQVNQVDFLNLLRAQVQLSNYQIQYWKAISVANTSLAHLQSVVGKESIYE